MKKLSDAYDLIIRDPRDGARYADHPSINFNFGKHTIFDIDQRKFNVIETYLIDKNNMRDYCALIHFMLESDHGFYHNTKYYPEIGKVVLKNIFITQRTQKQEITPSMSYLLKNGRFVGDFFYVTSEIINVYKFICNGGDVNQEYPAKIVDDSGNQENYDNIMLPSRISSWKDVFYSLGRFHRLTSRAKYNLVSDRFSVLRRLWDSPTEFLGKILIIDERIDYFQIAKNYFEVLSIVQSFNYNFKNGQMTEVAQYCLMFYVLMKKNIGKNLFAFAKIIPSYHCGISVDCYEKYFKLKKY